MKWRTEAFNFNFGFDDAYRVALAVQFDSRKKPAEPGTDNQNVYTSRRLALGRCKG